MRDVTPTMLLFKEAIRHIWNAHFVPSFEFETNDLGEIWTELGYYQEISDRMFKALVLRKLGLPEDSINYGSCPVPVPGLFVVPDFGTEISVMINRDNETKGRWSKPQMIGHEAFGECLFIEFFNWGQASFLDLPLVRCRSETAACEYLVEHHHCRFMVHSVDMDIESA